MGGDGGGGVTGGGGGGAGVEWWCGKGTCFGDWCLKIVFAAGSDGYFWTVEANSDTSWGVNTSSP